jgi:xanthine phosphoribosyltransferase
MNQTLAHQQEISITWAELHIDARTLAKQLKNITPWKGIIAITRGGLIPAALIAQELNIRLIETICISSYEDKSAGIYAKQSEPELIKTVDGNGQGFLLIDDLVDSGKTASLVKALLPEAHLATLYAKPSGKAYANSFVKEFAQHQWVIFPWESNPT